MKKSELKKIIKNLIIEQSLANDAGGTLTLDPQYDGGVGGGQKPPTAMATAILNGEESAMINRFKDYIKQGTNKDWDAIPKSIVQGFIQQYTNEVEPRAVNQGADTDAFFQALGINPADTQGATPEVELKPDVELVLKYSDKINTKIEWVNLINSVADLEVRGISPTIKAQVMRQILKRLS